MQNVEIILAQPLEQEAAQQVAPPFLPLALRRRLARLKLMPGPPEGIRSSIDRCRMP